MAKDVEAKMTKLYGQLSAAQQASVAQAIADKLTSIIGGYGELSVLCEYIIVMLQSSRPPEQIRSELETFLQEQSVPFTTWLCEHIAKMAKEAPVVVEEAAGGKKRRREKRAERDQAASPAADGEVVEKKKAKKEKRNASLVAAAAPAPRSRSRKRRKSAEGAAGNGSSGKDRKAKLTPNVESLKEAYHAPKETQETPKTDTSGPVAPPAEQLYAPHPYYLQPPSAHHYHFAPPGAVPVAVAALAPARPAQFFAPKKWRVLRANTVVRATEQLESPEVQKLQEGEIVEQVSPPLVTEQGLVRIQIRHPSSPVFPNPIGWVTQDATAAGGPKFLEPGPEAKYKPPSTSASTYWRPPAPMTWRPRGVPPPRPVRPVRPPYGRSFQNLTWKPPPTS
eukprot:TRINITY_DN112534_c0_g1_i1.p1 TRINITY_DN112534_c0_g1~~TRINITY_DN112534_c0_g1_i1.p1  ORF type:complete len:401 (-),score=83.37 TRINITY_DN112534_c0_g1_i1:18-1196(-)